jgi:pilus assembly protein CpaE
MAQGHADEMLLSSSLTRHGNDVFVLPAPPEIEGADSVGHAEAKAALELMRARFRYTLVDTARTITGATVAALETSRRILVVTDLSVPGIRSMRRLIDLFSHLGVPADHVEAVVTETAHGAVTLQDAARVIGKPPFFVVPRDEASASGAMNHGAPLNGKPSRLAVAMDALAAKVAGVHGAPKLKSGQLFRRFFGRSHEVPT